MNKKEDKKLPGQGESMTLLVPRRAPDFENAGVAVVIRRTLVCSLKTMKTAGSRIIKATFATSGSDVSLFAHAPHSAYDIEAIYERYILHRG